MYTLGVRPTQVFTAADISGESAGLNLALGTRAVNQDGNEYILLAAAEAITQDGLAGFWTAAHVFTPVTTATVTGGRPLAVSRGLPTAANQRFWAQVFGRGAVYALTSAAANVLLSTSVTAGALEDVATAHFPVLGIQLTTAVGAGGAAAAPAIIDYPRLGAIVGA